eukprot:361947-Chlamydomonas_euryale.AAC.16
MAERRLPAPAHPRFHSPSSPSVTSDSDRVPLTWPSSPAVRTIVPCAVPQHIDRRRGAPQLVAVGDNKLGARRRDAPHVDGHAHHAGRHDHLWLATPRGRVRHALQVGLKRRVAVQDARDERLNLSASVLDRMCREQEARGVREGDYLAWTWCCHGEVYQKGEPGGTQGAPVGEKEGGMRHPGL